MRQDFFGTPAVLQRKATRAQGTSLIQFVMETELMRLIIGGRKLKVEASILISRLSPDQIRGPISSFPSYHSNPTGAHTTNKDSMFAGANGISIYNCTFNNIENKIDAVQAITVLCRYLPSITH